MSPTSCLSSYLSDTSYVAVSPDCGEKQILFLWHPLAQVQALICMFWRTVAPSHSTSSMLAPKVSIPDWGRRNRPRDNALLRWHRQSCSSFSTEACAIRSLQNVTPQCICHLWVQVPGQATLLPFLCLCFGRGSKWSWSTCAWKGGELPKVDFWNVYNIKPRGCEVLKMHLNPRKVYEICTEEVLTLAAVVN